MYSLSNIRNYGQSALYVFYRHSSVHELVNKRLNYKRCLFTTCNPKHYTDRPTDRCITICPHFEMRTIKQVLYVNYIQRVSYQSDIHFMLSIILTKICSIQHTFSGLNPRLVQPHYFMSIWHNLKKIQFLKETTFKTWKQM